MKLRTQKSDTLVSRIARGSQLALPQPCNSLSAKGHFLHWHLAYMSIVADESFRHDRIVGYKRTNPTTQIQLARYTLTK